MTTFDRREDAFENRFARDEELMFKAHARRNRQLGLWAAQHLGKQGVAADDYAQALVATGIEGGGDDAIARKLQHDFGLGGVTQSQQQIRHTMDALLAEALQVVRSA